MSLPLSDIVQVDIAVSPTLAPLAGFGELLFLTNDAADLAVLTPAERQRKFGSLKEVEDAFPANSQCITAAKAFYMQTPQPKHFTVGVMATSAAGGSLLGGEHANLEELLSITAGSMKITIDGVEKNVTAIDFSSATTLAGVAAALQNRITAVTRGSKAVSCSVDYQGGRFVITGITTGENGYVSFAEDVTAGQEVATKLGLTAEKAFNSVHGVNAETVGEALSMNVNVSNSFVGVALHKDLRDSETHISGEHGAALWCQANKKLFMNTTNDVRILNVTSQSSTEAKKLEDKALGFTITSFGRAKNEYPSISLFARIATVNYEGRNTTITLKFKKLPGITALNLTAAQKAAMDAINVGGFMDFGGNLMYAESRMADGGWLDAVHGLMWLEDRIKKGVFNLMYGTTTKIPYTDTGINMVVQKVTSALEQGVANGLIAPGTTPEGEFLPTGYKIDAMSSIQVAKEDKSNRIYRGLTFKCVGAGALHGAIISGSFSE